jgi:hypothetical protein
MGLWQVAGHAKRRRRAAFTSAAQPNSTPPPDEIFFGPHADGISDLVCTVLVAHQADSPVQCAARW